jgi:hypothetical protein
MRPIVSGLDFALKPVGNRLHEQRRSLMQLKDMMTPAVARLPHDASVQEVAQKMKAIDVG